jgi:hypothetical protein
LEYFELSAIGLGVTIWYLQEKARGSKALDFLLKTNHPPICSGSGGITAQKYSRLPVNGSCLIGGKGIS